MNYIYIYIIKMRWTKISWEKS